jgi:predicted SAM-dependent methyltransferase
MFTNTNNGEPLRLHIGGKEAKAGWKIFDIIERANVDYVGNCTDLSIFADNSVSEIYASHILEHLGYDNDLPLALRELYRVLTPRATLRISVPNLDVLCRLFIHPEVPPNVRFDIMRIMFGGRTDQYDVHQTGFNLDFLSKFLTQAGFNDVQQVKEFGLFQDASNLSILGNLISLNVTAKK